MAKIDRYCAPGVFDPPSYSQAVKVTGGETIGAKDDHRPRPNV